MELVDGAFNHLTSEAFRSSAIFDLPVRAVLPRQPGSTRRRAPVPVQLAAAGAGFLPAHLLLDGLRGWAGDCVGDGLRRVICGAAIAGQGLSSAEYLF